jgi:hypothetical protein
MERKNPLSSNLTERPTQSFVIWFLAFAGMSGGVVG